MIKSEGDARIKNTKAASQDSFLDTFKNYSKRIRFNNYHLRINSAALNKVNEHLLLSQYHGYWVTAEES